jgi:hypothetical protein
MKNNKKKKTTGQKNHWNSTDPEVFKRATWNLCQTLDKDDIKRTSCKGDKDTAKSELKTAGNFDKIPDDVEVFVMENQVKAGANVVVIKLMAKGSLPTKYEDFEAKTVWTCTWNHYISAM